MAQERGAQGDQCLPDEEDLRDQGSASDGPPTQNEHGEGRAIVPLGRIGKAQGIRGEVRFTAYNPESSLIFELAEVLLLMGAPDRVEVAGVDSLRAGPGGSLVIRFAHCSTRNDAEALRGVEVAVPREALPELPDGEWYHRDLAGLTAVDDAGAEIGWIEAVIPYPTVDCLVLILPDGRKEVPMADPFLVDVSLPARTIQLTALEELPVLGEKRAAENIGDEPGVHDVGRTEGER